MTAHALLSPSGASRWLSCAASLWMEKDEPSTTSDAAKEGTVAHELAERCIKGNLDPSQFIDQEIIFNHPPVDADMAGHVTEYIDRINFHQRGFQTIHHIEIEQRLEFTDVLFKGAPPSFGTADVILIGDNELQVHDLKYGKGVRVEADGNIQLRIYALAAYHYYSLLYDIDNVTIFIHQPRLNHFPYENITVKELLAFGKKLKSGAKKAYTALKNGAKDADFNPGESQCRFCRAKNRCAPLANYSLKTVGFEDLDAPEYRLTNDHLAVCYAALPAIKNWVKVVEKTVYNELIEGRVIEGFKLVLGKSGHSKWIDDDEAQIVLKTFDLTDGDIYTINLISPSQAMKLLAKEDRPQLDEFITRGKSQPVIVSDTDKRAAYVPELIKFDNIDDETIKQQNN